MIDTEAFKKKWAQWEDAALDPQTLRADFFDVLTALSSLQSWATGAKVDIEGLQQERDELMSKLRKIDELHTMGNVASDCDCYDGLTDCPTRAIVRA